MIVMLLQVPNPFPIPVFREITEKNIAKKRLAGDDRKYMVRVLATMLNTYVQKPTMKHCGIVAESLVMKYSFLKESVSFPSYPTFLIIQMGHIN